MATSTQMYKVNALANKTGLAFVIKVTAGDVINIYGKSYFNLPGESFTDANSSQLILSDILSAFLGNPANPASQHNVTMTDLQTANSGSVTSLGTLIHGADGTSNSSPKA